MHFYCRTQIWCVSTFHNRIGDFLIGMEISLWYQKESELDAATSIMGLPQRYYQLQLNLQNMIVKYFFAMMTVARPMAGLIDSSLLKM